MLHSFGGGFIRQMPVTPENSLFETPRSIRALLKELDVVVCFHNKRVCGANSFDDKPRCMPQVCQETNISCFCAQEEAYGILCIVGNGESFNTDVSDVKTCSGFKKPAVQRHFDLSLDGFLRRAVAIDRSLEFISDYSQALDVVDVFVGDENAC